MDRGRRGSRGPSPEREVHDLGHVYIGQPPLYQIARKKRVENVEDDAQLNRILIQLGTDEVRLRNLRDDKELTEKQLSEILELLEASKVREWPAP